MDKYSIDSHKLMYHVKRVNDWLDGKTIYPIYMEISPSGACNHRCVYCGLDFMGYKPKYLDPVILRERLTELGRLGLKSVMYAGEGEPFLHPDMPGIIRHTAKAGIDVGITTNGVLLDKKIADKILGSTTWIKVSINGATPETHAKIHGCGLADFGKVIENMSYAAEARKKNNYACTLGMQLVLLPENAREVTALAKLARDIGMDYLVVKPYSQHPQSRTTRYAAIKYSDYDRLADKLVKFNTYSFEVIFRKLAMKKWDDGVKSCDRCLALPFWSYIDAGGNVWGCSIYLGDKRFLYGNIYKQTFRQIWEGGKRRRSLLYAEKKLDTSKCRVNCRMDEINKYLWKLKQPHGHVNFI